MIDPGDDQQRDDAALEKALRGQPPVEADEAFRRRLRESFVSGELDRRPRRRFLLPLGAAAAVLAVVAGALVIGVLVFGSHPPEFLVFEVSGSGNVIVNGLEIPVTDRDRLERSIGPGADVSVPPTATLDLVVPGTALFELTGGTRMTLPWSPSDAPGRLKVGEVRFISGPDFAGREMTLSTPEGIVVVTGTLLSVQCDDGGTCVCVLEGTARVGVDESDMELIPPGRRKVMMRSGEVEISAVAPPHRQGVMEFLERTADRFPRE